MALKKRHMLFFGFGYSAQALARHLSRDEWMITGTSRSPEGADAIRAQGYNGLVFSDMKTIPVGTTHVVISVPPDADGDAVLRTFEQQLQHLASLQWLAYLSTTGVYGDHGGAWVDENTPLAPNTERGHRRLAAEQAWIALFVQHQVPVHIFRLSGIYGPGRNALESMKGGTAKRVIREGQVFSRIHVEDIAGILAASIRKPNPGRAYNVADDEPCPPQDVITHAALLLNMAPPPEIPFEHAQLSPMAKSFFMDSKSVSNTRVKHELEYVFQFPDYRAGLKSLL
jgi:nucleoside-diphosphate-sugar epimerase